VEPPLTAIALAAWAEPVTVIAVVAAAVAVTAPGAVTLRAVAPVQVVASTTEPVAPEVILIVSILETLDATGVAYALVRIMFSVSSPAPPSTVSPVDQVSPAATVAAVNVSLPAVPVKLSAPTVSVIASYSAISL